MRLSLIAAAITLALASACSTTQPAVTAGKDEANAVAESEAKVAANELDQIAATGSRQRADLAKVAERREATAMAGAQMVAPPPPSPPAPVMDMAAAGQVQSYSMPASQAPVAPEVNTERYADLDDNPVHVTAENPVSTFSIDVDTGSYSNVRRMLVAGQRPPRDAVRAEEMINYFDYDLPVPGDRKTPFRVTTELAPAPWNRQRQLLMVGIKGYEVPKAQIPASNLVFLLDTSGSMESPDKLPLVKESLRRLVPTLRPQDRISIVVYAGSAGLVLPPTPGDRHEEIIAALDQLGAGGSTNGGEGIQLAYAMARQAFVPGGVNRIVLATDGDFNVGTVDQTALETLVADQRKTGIALTTLGFGTGNYNDHLAEKLADVGNGNHAYIDTLAEARKVLGEELSSTLMTIAQDVKIQVEFNPAVVAEYRLIGYENRVLAREDFNNDKVDAGEIGAGHDVTALYELTLVGSGGQRVDPLRYGAPVARDGRRDEVGLLRLRYKQPGAESSRLIETPLHRSLAAATPSPRLRMASAVAAYADLLRGGEHMDGFGWTQVAALAAGAGSPDPWGHRAEFLQLVERAREVTGDKPAVAISH